ncbi:Histone acetyltransferase, partial [Phytophthora palmivora]
MQMQQQQRQQQYANQMMMNQQNGQQQQFAGQPYQQQMHSGQMPGGVSGAPPTSAAGQYMGGQPGQSYRPPTSSYEEEFARVKAMMMQHPDLIPPPMEVLRISMSQSAASQQSMAMNANTYMQRGNPAMARAGAPGNAAYGQYGNPNMMMAGPQQNAQQAGMMNAARMRAAQMAQQQAQQRATAGQTPGRNNDTQTAWQSENDLPLRRKMIGKIVSLLQQRKPDAPAEWIRRLPDMARRLEDSLYRTAKNRDEYGDFSSLKTRLQHLAVTMGARAQHKAGGNPRAGGGAGGVPGNAGGAAANAGMMAGSAPPGMGMNPGAGGMGPQGHVVGNMPYGNRMTQQQLMQQQHLQMQMQQNPQMRQQLTPQQLQQFQEAQLQRRQLQMQQAQQ